MYVKIVSVSYLIYLWSTDFKPKGRYKMNNYTEIFTTQEASERIGIGKTTITRWEKDYAIDVPRDKSGARLYTEAELDIFLDIKKMREQDLTKAEIRSSLFDKITKNNANQKSSEEIRELEITEKFQEIKRLFHIYPELIDLVAPEIKSHLDQHPVTDGTSLEAIKETVATAIQEGINKELSTISNLYKTEVNRRDELMIEIIRLKKRVKSLESKPSLFKVFSG